MKIHRGQGKNLIQIGLFEWTKIRLIKRKSSPAAIIYFLLLALTMNPAWALAATPTKLPNGMFSTLGNQIVDQNQNPVRLSCVYWEGMNIEDGSLVNQTQPYASLQANVAAIAATGFNCIRIDINNISLSTSGASNFLTQLDNVVTAAGSAGLRIIIVDHDNEGQWQSTVPNTDCAAEQANGIWYDLGGASDGTDGCGDTGHTTQASYNSAWVNIAARYAGNNTVIGYDLWNEPYSSGESTWGDSDTNHDIHLMYQTVGSAILAEDSSKLIFVECPHNYSTPLYDGTTAEPAPWGDCTGVKNHPVVFTVNGQTIVNKVVYDVHLYPDSISGIASLFGGSSASAAAITAMNDSFGFIVSQNIAPVWDGEGGTGLAKNPDDTAWAAMLDNYLNGQGGTGAPTFSGSQQGMGIAWMGWNTSEGDSDDLGLLEWTGVAESDGTTNYVASAQLQYVNPLLYYPTSGLPANGSMMHIVNAAFSQCVDMASASQTTGTQFDLYPCNTGWWQQQYTVEQQSDGTYLFANRGSNLCVEVSAGSTSPGAMVEQDTCNSNYWSQRFTLVASGNSYSLKNLNSGLCVVANSNGLLQQQACTGASAQLYRFQ